MVRREIWLLILLCCCIVLPAQDKPAQDKPAEDPAVQWEDTIRQFEQWDSKNTFPLNAVLFVGSSSIRMWPTRECFDGLEVINRGFGGSQISDVNYFAERIVMLYEPKVIVFYAGDNDVAAGKSAQRVFDDYKKFVNLVHEEMAETRIIYIGIKPSGSRWSLWPVMNEANMMIKEFSAKNARLYYFDSAAPLLNGDGKPDPAFFLEDQLHLNEQGYEVWTKSIRPMINEALKATAKKR